ncbi:hypothetical protein ACHHYP_08984 [Achlya hypogyna]|uniref:Uncharacterized protein n=1 Tax=Achlya hypogyna TaxID=1202772 RepID=A0A1V9ZJN9_ACHHY|nr:hypothetical protein ACHHYP_08984 [Achlya hypogyna]
MPRLSDAAAAALATCLAGHVLKSASVGRDYSRVRVASQHALAGTLAGVCVSPLDGTLLVCDVAHACVLVLDRGLVVHTLGSRGGNPGKFLEPTGIACNGHNGHIAVSDAKINRVQIFNSQYTLVAHFGKSGARPDQFAQVAGLVFTPDGHHLVIADTGNHRIKIVTPTGLFVRAFGSPGASAGEFSSPCDVAVNRRGEMFVADRGNDRVQVFSPTGDFVTLWGTPLVAPHSIAIAPDDTAAGDTGDIVVCDQSHVRFYSQTGLLSYQLALPETCGVDYRARHVVLTQLPSLVTICAPYSVVPAGVLAGVPVVVFERILTFLSYQDAIPLRQTNKFYHRTCKHLRDTWQLHPLNPGAPPRLQYGRVVEKASGLQAIHELYSKWGEHAYASITRPETNGLRLTGSFQSAISELFGPMFLYSHEEALAVVFQYHADIDKVVRREGFIELVTVLMEIQAGVLDWHHCRAFADAKRTVPPRRKQDAHPLERLESAQSYQLDKLVTKLKTLV